MMGGIFIEASAFRAYAMGGFRLVCWGDLCQCLSITPVMGNSDQSTVKQIFSRLKPYLRWFIFGGTLFFLATTLKDYWQEVMAIRIDGRGIAVLAIALLITLLAHIWSGWVWGWILRYLEQPVNGFWSIRVYLKTNIAKYLPGNIWHFYGRVSASKEAGVPLSAAILSVLLEPLLMAASALLIAVMTLEQQDYRWLQFLSLGAVLVAVHPLILNPVLRILSRGKKAALATETSEVPVLRLQHYPVLPLLGELSFLGIRGLGFLCTVLALGAVNPAQIPFLIGAFSFAWLLGLVLPGAPGGAGVFEVTAIALLRQEFPVGLMLGAVAFYRLISVLAEVLGAGMAWLYERREAVTVRN